jgi:hypothetical protein
MLNRRKDGPIARLDVVAKRKTADGNRTPVGQHVISHYMLLTAII